MNAPQLKKDEYEYKESNADHRAGRCPSLPVVGKATNFRLSRSSALWVMKTNSQTLDDGKLRALLRESRLAPDLPPGFQNAVWRRIERAEKPTPTLSAADWLDWVAIWFLRPRRALATAAAMLLLGLSLGIAEGASHANELAKERYLDSVSPPGLRQ
jgi:hypothetical protein